MADIDDPDNYETQVTLTGIASTDKKQLSLWLARSNLGLVE